MTEEQFIDKYEKGKHIYKAWGDYVRESIIKKMSVAFNDNLEMILKIAPSPRLKDNNSIIQKAFYRKKNYSDPYNDITDKIGVRFVVLTEEDVKKVTEIIDDETSWVCSQDRDFDEEREKNPLLFSYQSNHFIVKNKEKLFYNNTSVPENIPCEIQVRTLLQHAYCELSHDIIYKPIMLATPQVQRLMARSMALIETTDGIFLMALNKMKNIEKPVDDFIKNLCILYRDKVGPLNYEPKINNVFFDSYKAITDSIQYNNVNDFYNESRNCYIFDQLRRKSSELFFRQPIALFIYYLVRSNEHQAKRYWPITDEILQKVFTDLGISFDY